MNHDDLRDRLAALDPTSENDLIPLASERGRQLLEETMQTIERPTDRRRPMWIGAVAAVFLVAVVGLGVGLIGDDTAPTGPPLVLTADGGQAAMMSCIPFDVGILSTMSPAFGGTVTEVTDSTATIEVDRWYTGGDAEIVIVEHTPGYEALIGTPTFELGERYLITAAEGAVNGCGYSGIATPEFEAAFEQAFGG